MKPVSAANACHLAIDTELLLDPRQPFWRGHGVVVDESDDVRPNEF